MKAAQGILTVRGGMTSHAAVVARGMGTCCVSGCGEIQMDEANKRFTLGGKVFTEGSEISIDGSTGKIYEGLLPTADAVIAGEFSRIMAWADKYRRLKVRTNADTPTDAKKARELGAEGIGLCRTEHMFFEEDRIAAFREMICADTAAEREAALDKILPYQQGDFEALFAAMEGNQSTSASLTRRCMSSCRPKRRISADWRMRNAKQSHRSNRSSPRCMSLIRCSDTAVCGLPSLIRRFRACRRAQSSVRRSMYRSCTLTGRSFRRS